MSPWLTPRHRPGDGRNLPTVGNVMENAEAGVGGRRNAPRCGPARQTSRPARGAMRPGCDRATENAGKGVGERRSSARMESLGNCRVRERERNAVQRVATWSATKPRGTALQRQASGPSPLADRSMSKLRCAALIQQLRRRREGAAGRGLRSKLQSEENAKLVCAPQVNRDG